MSSQSPDSSIAPAHRKALDWLRAGPKKLLIGGKWVGAISGRTFETSDPASETLLAEVAEAGSQDVDAAVTAARHALEILVLDRGFSSCPHARAAQNR